MKLFATPMIGLCLILTLPLPAATIHVPADQPTIQAGIDAAVDGDIVLVSDGVWTGYGNKELDFGGRAITVASESGPAECIIDCENSGRGFTFTGGEGPDTVVRGFTIINGYRFTGGGIRCFASSPTINGCVIQYCVADSGGGGAIHCLDGAAPLITGNTMTNNLAHSGFGGALFAENASPVIEDNEITYNTADFEGGAVYCTASTVRIAGNTLSHNSTLLADPSWWGDGGGAISAKDGSTMEIESNIISANSSTWYGGAISASFSTAAIRLNTINDNQVNFSGAGIYLYYTISEIAGNTIIDNTILGSGASDMDGGGGVIRSCNGTVITGNTISGNSTPREGGGLMIYDSDDCVVTNNRFEGNIAGRYGGGLYLGYFTGTVTDSLLIDN